VSENEDTKGLHIKFEDYQHLGFIITQKRFENPTRKYVPSKNFVRRSEALVREPSKIESSIDEPDFFKDIQSSRGSSRSLRKIVSQSLRKKSTLRVKFEENLIGKDIVESESELLES
jgi:hypothetical protein